MNISFKIADTFATNLYILGLATGSESFAPLSFSDRKLIQNQIVGRVPTGFSLGKNYQKAKIIKSKILLGEKSELLKEIQNKVNEIEFQNIDLTKAKSLQKDLELQYEKSTKQIEYYFNSKLIDSGIPITVFIMPMIGEMAESLGRIMVVGDGFTKKIAFPILLEEIIHSLLDDNIVDDITSDLELANLEHLNKEEIATGFLLYQLLVTLNYSKNVINSVVFDWHGGERASFVRQLIARYF